MDNAVTTIVTTLIEAGNVDTVYRDVYLDRARALFTHVMPVDEFRRLEHERSVLSALPAAIERALDKAQWALVKELSERADAMTHAIADRAAMLEIARTVYDTRDVRLDPFSPGLEAFTRIPRRDLAALRARMLGALAALERADAVGGDFYAERRRAFQAQPKSLFDVAADPATSRSADALEAARQALKVGDMKRLAALAESIASRATHPAGAPHATPGLADGEASDELRPTPYSPETLARARQLGLTARHVEPRLDLAALRRYAWTPFSDTREHAARGDVKVPPGVPENFHDGLAMFMIHPMVTSGGARYLPSLAAEDVLIEDFPEPAEGDALGTSALLQSLRLSGRRGLPRIAIEEALLLHGGRILEHDLGIDSRVFRLVCIPADVYVRLGEAEGWGQQPYWTHFDGYLIRVVAGQMRLQALAGGDTRYGGLYEMLAVGRDYASDRLLARFAVVQRARMAAWC